MIPQIERGLSQYEHIIHELEVLLDALDNLSNGLLSHRSDQARTFTGNQLYENNYQKHK